MPRVLVISHPEVIVDPDIPVTDWRLSGSGRQKAERFAMSDRIANVTHVWSSTETKARETARIIARPRDLPISFDDRLCENDRRATGFLPPVLFEAAANAFFAEPGASFRGWETAFDAQARIVQAVRDIAEHHVSGDVAVVTHGAVGTLLYCHLQGLTIDRAHDQPGQGHYWSADLMTLRPDHGWTPMS